MLDKVRNGLNLFILFMFALAILAGIITIIINLFTSNKETNYITKQNVDIYVTNSNLIKTDYSTFYSIEKCIQDVIISLHEGKNSEVYNILTDDMKATIGNKDKLTEYYNNNFKYDISADLSIEGYQNTNNLKQVYKVDNTKNDMYICVVTSINKDKATKIGITVIDSATYIISYIDM